MLPEKCPKCHKKPRISVSPNGLGYDCVVRCKPFLRKPHLSVSVYRARKVRAVEKAIEEWNNKCLYKRKSYESGVVFEEK